MKAVVAKSQPHRVVSVLDPEAMTPDLGSSYAGRHLRLSFHDLHEPEPGATLPAAEDIGGLLQFLESWSPGELLLIHCRAGISRSPATAFIAACSRWPSIPELEIARELRRAAPLARPNGRMIGLADELMGRQGRMSEAMSETGRGLPWIEVDEGDPFEFGAQFDLIM